MSWLERLKKVFEVKVRATVFTPSLTGGLARGARKPTTFEDDQMEASQEVLLAARCYAEQHEQVGSSFAFRFMGVPAYIAETPEFKVGLFTQAARYKLECTAVTFQSAFFKRIA